VEVKAVLGRFVTRILHHPAVLSSPPSLHTRLSFELQTFLLAHIQHAEDNHRLRAQWDQASNPNNGITNGNGNGNSNVNNGTANTPSTPNPPPQQQQYHNPGRTFYHWVRSTSADHTSCPFSFIFYNCLVHAASSNKKTAATLFTLSARAAYLAEDACRHLASLCRMYNDAGSAARDADERALNSVNFPEFFLTSPQQQQQGQKGQKKCGDVNPKEELLWIADYERRGLETAIELLEEEVGGSHGGLVGALRLFVRVTDLYGQIYVLQDVGTRTR
jgi:hypothetical protein